MEKLYAFVLKGEEVIGDDFLLGLTKEVRERGLFVVYQTTARPPIRLKVVHENKEGDGGGRE